MAALAPYLEFGPEEETTPPIEPTQPDPPAVTDYEKLKTHVVKIESAKANGQDTGGGVIVGVDGGLVLVATAFHVVEDATDVKVYFMEKQYAPFNATVFQKFHADLDLAVVVVNTAGGAAMPALPEPIKLRKSADIQEGLKVVAIGHSGGLDWQLAFNAVVRTSDPEDGRKLRFSKTGVVPGYSGGGLFDDSGKLLGIVTHIDAQHGLAVKIEDVIKEVSGQWHVPVNRLAP